ncbi:hypothetical protein KQI86_02735 [Clostridium sp. MSJ-11]|uniref:Uncharacterized protein n=1 Tax=Clostridium mobile TaxID=2841512 RepID=A0ABS6EDF2_9CLOT|nr:hypothetical protein [Clostridium mobile]MBU5483227.1 hypothetical protein [Clostridium mobile]
MNLVDLREFEFEMNKIISFENSEFIFGNKEFEEGIYKNYIYTNSYEVQEDCTKTSIYAVSLIDESIDKLYSIKKEASTIFLSERYVLFMGNDFEIDEEHSDVQKDIHGEYDYAILCNLKDKKEYEVKDKRVVLGIRDYFIPYDIDDSRHIAFEEAYMEDWELEEMFWEGIKKENFYRNGYRESINIISLQRFIQFVKSGCKLIPFNQIHNTELTAWIRYFGMDDESIYYRVKDFESKIQHIYSVNKKTLEKKLLKSIQMNDSKFSYSTNFIWYDIENRRIYEIRIIENKIKQIKEIFDEDFTFEYGELKEDFEGIIEDYFITSFWTEDDNGDNYKNFVKIRDIKNGNINSYEGTCVILKDNIILFK